MNSEIIFIVIGVIAAIFGILLSKTQSRLQIENLNYQTSSRPLKAFVLGGTGTVGRGIVKALLENPSFDKVTIIGRRRFHFEGEQDDPKYDKIHEEVIDFEDPSTYVNIFQGYDIGFCSLGISSIGITNEEYFRITHDYVLNTAKHALAGGCFHFHFVSGLWTHKHSAMFWSRTKSKVEEKIAQLGFDRVSIYRPGVVVKEMNEEKTGMETAGILTVRILDPFHFWTVDSLLLGRVIVNNTFRIVTENSEILENCDIHKLGKQLQN